MDTDDKISQLEYEIEGLRKEVQAVSLELRRNHLKARNQLDACTPLASQQATPIRRIPASVPGPEEKLAISILGKQSQKNTPGCMGIINNNVEPQTTRRELERSPQPVRDSHFTKADGAHEPGWKLDIVNIAELVHWVEESIRQMGRERTEAVMDISEKMGFLPPGMKQILSKITRVEQGDNKANIANAVSLDYLDSLVRVREKRREVLDSLLSVES